MVLSEKEELLVKTLRSLPTNTADDILRWTQGLAELSGGKPDQWSDEWSAEDIDDARAHSLRGRLGRGSVTDSGRPWSRLIRSSPIVPNIDS